MNGNVAKVKTCPCCKQEKPIESFYGHNKAYKTSYWCSKCYNRYKMGRQRDRRKAFVRLLGDKCSKCGIRHTGKNTPIFDFHHREEGKKKGDWATMRHRSLERQRDEIKKCILLCANCHRMIHAKNWRD